LIVFSNEADLVEIGSSLRDKPARELVCPVTISNLKTCAHVGQADMGREVNGPLLARPAGAEVLQLKPPIPKHRLPGWLAQPEGKFQAMPIPIYNTQDIPPALHLRYTRTG